MRVPIIALFAAALAFAQTDESAIREVVQKYVNARELRDPKAVEALFAEDADQLVSDGVWRKGREVIVKGTLESSQRSGGRRTIEVQSVRMLSADVAVADGRYAAGDRQMWTSILLRRTRGGWRIAGDCTTGQTAGSGGRWWYRKSFSSSSGSRSSSTSSSTTGSGPSTTRSRRRWSD